MDLKDIKDIRDDSPVFITGVQRQSSYKLVALNQEQAIEEYRRRGAIGRQRANAPQLKRILANEKTRDD